MAYSLYSKEAYKLTKMNFNISAKFISTRISDETKKFVQYTTPTAALTYSSLNWSNKEPLRAEILKLLKKTYKEKELDARDNFANGLAEVINDWVFTPTNIAVIAILIPPSTADSIVTYNSSYAPAINGLKVDFINLFNKAIPSGENIKNYKKYDYFDKMFNAAMQKYFNNFRSVPLWNGALTIGKIT